MQVGLYCHRETSTIMLFTGFFSLFIIQLVVTPTAGYIPHRCEHWKDAGYTDSAYYVIQPDPTDRSSAMVVWCDMDSATTLVSHGNETLFVVNGYEGPDSFLLTLQYDRATIAQIRALARLSERCWYDIRFDCRDVTVGQPDTHWWDVEGTPQLWVDHNGTLCNTPPPCTCVGNPNAWRKDEGTLTVQQDLFPMTAVSFADTGGGNEVLHVTISPFKCNLPNINSTYAQSSYAAMSLVRTLGLRLTPTLAVDAGRTGVVGCVPTCRSTAGCAAVNVHTVTGACSILILPYLSEDVDSDWDLYVFEGIDLNTWLVI